MRQHFCFSLSFSIKTGVPRWSHTRYFVTCQSSCLRVSYIFYIAAKHGLLTTKSYRTPFHSRAWFFVSLSLPILTDRYMIPWVYTDERGDRLFGTLYHWKYSSFSEWICKLHMSPSHVAPCTWYWMEQGIVTVSFDGFYQPRKHQQL